MRNQLPAPSPRRCVLSFASVLATLLVSCGSTGSGNSGNAAPPPSPAPTASPAPVMPAPTPPTGSVTTTTSETPPVQVPGGTGGTSGTPIAAKPQVQGSPTVTAPTGASTAPAAGNNHPAANYTPGQPQIPGYPTSGPQDPSTYGPEAALWMQMQGYGATAIAGSDFLSGSPEQATLGGRLFHEPLLSAHRDVTCGSCHIEAAGTSNNYSLSPSGAVLSGRKTGALSSSDLLPRNVPALFNLGHASFNSMFWDARVARDAKQPSGYTSPAGAALPLGLNSALAAQALFPLLGAAEMGDVSYIQLTPTQIWAQLAARVLALPEYRAMFAAAYPDVKNGQYGIELFANAIAVFEAQHWRADGAPFDQYLRGNANALSQQQKDGAGYFYGKGGCAACHSGPLFTDHAAHAVGVPQFGPGLGDGIGGLEDFGIGRVTGLLTDRYKFRTPSLRNVALTGPWGHDGAFSSLRDFVSHYRSPAASPSAAFVSMLPQGFTAAMVAGAAALPASQTAISAATEIGGVPLTDAEVDAIVAFLQALTDPASGPS